MLRKSVLGFAILAAGLLVWSCGDGSVDSLTDTELLMISRFPSTIDYDMLDSIVEACKKDEACWEKAKKIGEIYKGDYTKVLRDSSGNIVIVEGDSAFIYDKSGKKLPVFNFSSNSNDDDDDDVTSSGSTATSGSSSKRSSASGYDVDEYTDGGDGADSNGSGSGGTSVSHDRSSSSKKSTSSSSVDLSFLNSSSSIKVLSSSTVIRSSSSKKVTSSSSVDLSFLSSSSSSLGVASSSSIYHERSSSSKIVVNVSSVSESSSSETVVQLSSSSATHHTGVSSNAMACGPQTLKGTCVALPSPGIKGESVTYTFTPAEDNTCNGYNEVEWNVTVENTGASIVHEEHSYNAPQQKYDFVVSFSTVGVKEGVQFSMGGENVVCDPLRVKSPCKTANTYQCSRTKIPADANDNIWKNNPKQISETIIGDRRTTSAILTNPKALLFSKEKELIAEVTEVSCASAYAVYSEEVIPNFAVSNITTFAGEASYKITPSSITGCNYDSDKCSYELKVTGESIPLSSGSNYTGGAITFEGMSTDAKVNYTLTLSNYLGPRSKTFDVTYVVVDETRVPSTTTFEDYAPGKYKITPSISHTFRCKSASTPTGSPVTVGSFDGKTIASCKENWCSTGTSVSAGQAYLLIINDDAPTDLQCGYGY